MTATEIARKAWDQRNVRPPDETIAIELGMDTLPTYVMARHRRPEVVTLWRDAVEAFTEIWREETVLCGWCSRAIESTRQTPRYCGAGCRAKGERKRVTREAA